MKYSRQRELILNTVIRLKGHPTADMVYRALRDELPNISLGTVYRNLRLLSEMGILRRISLPDGADRFDARVDGHDHMVCTRCGRIFDISLGILSGLEQSVTDQTGFQVASHSLVMEGLCKDCQINIQKERGI